MEFYFDLILKSKSEPDTDYNFEDVMEVLVNENIDDFPEYLREKISKCIEYYCQHKNDD